MNDHILELIYANKVLGSVISVEWIQQQKKYPKVKTHTEPLTRWLKMDSLATMVIKLSQMQLDWHKPTPEVEYVLEKWCAHKLEG